MKFPREEPQSDPSAADNFDALPATARQEVLTAAASKPLASQKELLRMAGAPVLKGKSIYQMPAAVRLLHSCVSCSLGAPGRWRGSRSFFKSWLKFPIEYSAQMAVESIPEATISELFPLDETPGAAIAPSSLGRHAWNVRTDELLFIGLAIKSLRAHRIFEIGTFNGATTRYMAEAAGLGSRVFTLDLPPNQFDATKLLKSFPGFRIGEQYRGTPEADRITQLFGDSTSFDYSPYLESMDFVFVDAAHDYIHGKSDSRTAMRLVRPGGAIFWHDFSPSYSGLVHAVVESAHGRPLRRIADTRLAVLRTTGSAASR